MTNQEAFNQIWQYFVVEKHQQSIDPINRCCMYRGPDGNKCAVGLLIPDSAYTTKMECKSVKQLIEHDVFPESLRGIGVAFLSRCQDAHDEWIQVSVWDEEGKQEHVSSFDLHMKRQLTGIADQYGLSVTTGEGK